MIWAEWLSSTTRMSAPSGSGHPGVGAGDEFAAAMLGFDVGQISPVCKSSAARSTGAVANILVIAGHGGLLAGWAEDPGRSAKGLDAGFSSTLTV